MPAGPPVRLDARDDGGRAAEVAERRGEQADASVEVEVAGARVEPVPVDSGPDRRREHRRRGRMDLPEPGGLERERADRRAAPGSGECVAPFGSAKAVPADGATRSTGPGFLRHRRQQVLQLGHAEREVVDGHDVAGPGRVGPRPAVVVDVQADAGPRARAVGQPRHGPHLRVERVELRLIHPPGALEGVAQHGRLQRPLPLRRDVPELGAAGPVRRVAVDGRRGPDVRPPVGRRLEHATRSRRGRSGRGSCR